MPSVSAHLATACSPPPLLLQTIPLASYEGVAASQVAPSTDSSPLPITVPRPLGPVVLMGIRHSYLWLADGLGRPYLVSLRHAGVRLRCLAARSELSTARTIAERGGCWMWGGPSIRWNVRWEVARKELAGSIPALNGAMVA